MRKNKQTCQPLTFFMLTIHLFKYKIQNVFLIQKHSFEWIYGVHKEVSAD